MWSRENFPNLSLLLPSGDAHTKTHWFYLTLAMLLCSINSGNLNAQPIDPQTIPNPLPRITPEPAEEPPLLPPPEELLQPPTPSAEPATPGLDPGGTVPGTIEVERFEILDSSIFSQEQLDKLLSQYTGRPLSFAELLQARSAITELYNQQGYITTGALIPPQTLENGVVQIQVVEGGLEEIRVIGTDRLSPDYIRSRLGRATDKPINIDELLEALRLLQLDPLIDTISAELSAGYRPGQNLLEVRITEAPAFRSEITLDNGRAPSVGTFRRKGVLTHGNLFGFGDRLNIAYSNTDGSDQWDVDYTLPINGRNGTLTVSHSRTSSEIIEPPFDRVDIEAKSRNSELTFRQPLVQSPTREFTLGLTAARRESNTSILDVAFPLSPGANEDGETRISALRFFQEWTDRSSQQVFAARSQFSLGVGWFDATVNAEEPDSRFLAWRGQAQWLRVLGSDDANPETSPTLLLRGDVQLATTSLLALEQFGLGGLQSVRGYRQDALLTDNGALASAEVRLPVYRTEGGEFKVQVVPFVDVGAAWNNGDRENPDPNTLASVGLGLQLDFGDRIRARLDWGYPLVDIESRDRTWQENGFYFSITSYPF
ncbi:ShlB/FhaC/HecB family hemolysin secretion/activation protein [Phormidium sp. CCY1219]|uniref:ShlB/FhaC/HecB family hemolysin secretion/activation protein n=1 Tax=Phormidium sp. CCY1219 TaxID=2886104 RepID=UPI002D1EFF0B|nr:ShlB/FhaC/HecB family hemolysin secretion/activation protein [Phormidium sp. CCY1219]MEB3828393.1 ShlB/FhaC/HecB family hemolysin secretion/activation protein [Phormidium sp. CCY1219]